MNEIAIENALTLARQGLIFESKKDESSAKDYFKNAVMILKC